MKCFDFSGSSGGADQTPGVGKIMTEQLNTVTVTTSHVLINQALEDLERAMPHSRPGDKVSLVAGPWRDTFIMTARYGWLRMPH